MTSKIPPEIIRGKILNNLVEEYLDYKTLCVQPFETMISKVNFDPLVISIMFHLLLYTDICVSICSHTISSIQKIDHLYRRSTH